MTLFEAIVIAVVEGITEFLPVSSTGHMVIASSLLGIGKDNFTKLFEVSIQLGAILAVVVLYWKKFIRVTDWKFYAKLAVGVLPALVFGFLFNDQIDALLESPLTVAISLLLGGIALLFIDNYFRHPQVLRDEEITFGKALAIGGWQVISMIPGVSRSAASIIGGMQQKLSRNVAAEFSFFLAVPTMTAATGYSLFLKKWEEDGGVQRGYEMILASQENTIAFVVGNIVAFVVALLAIRLFINYLKAFGFRIFGLYRILVGILLMILWVAGAFES